MASFPLSIVLSAALLLPPAAGRAGPPVLCSLDWAGVVQSFGPQSGWKAAGPPIPLALGVDATPDYQAQIFATAIGDRAALVVAEWGEPGSPELGRSCTVPCATRRVGSWRRSAETR